MADRASPDPLPHLPPPPARVLVAGPPARVRAVEVAGHRVERLPSPPGPAGGADGEGEPRHPGNGAPEAQGTAGELEAAVLELPSGEVPDPALLATLHRRLGEEGRLVVAGAAPGTAERPATAEPPGTFHLALRRLQEAGYAVLHDEGRPEARPEARPQAGAGSASGTDPGFLLVARPSPYRVRPYREGDEAAILDLFERAFHHRRSLPRWQWAYRDDPWGAHRTSLAVDGPAVDGPAVEDEERLAAHYAGYPVPFWTDLPELGGDGGDGAGRTLAALHVGDTMTAPEARRVGRGRTSLLARTVEHFYATFCHGRVDFNYGTNTGKIQRFSRRTAGALRVEDAPYRVRELDRPFAAPGPLGALLGGWRVEKVAGPQALDEGWDRLWERCRGAYRFLLQRDRTYLRWRYACPDVDYHLWAVRRWGRLVGWSAFRQQGERLFWGDALFDPRHRGAPAVLLSRVVAAPEHRPSRLVEAWLTDRPAWWGQTVESLGFQRRPEPEDLGLVYVPFRLDPASAMDRHLYYTKADFDLF